MYRLAKANSHCRLCDRINKRGEDWVIYFYSIRSRGQNILLCPKCAIKVGEAVPTQEASND